MELDPEALMRLARGGELSLTQAILAPLRAPGLTLPQSAQVRYEPYRSR
jgi:hypothetical protein